MRNGEPEGTDWDPHAWEPAEVAAADDAVEVDAHGRPLGTGPVGTAPGRRGRYARFVQRGSHLPPTWAGITGLLLALIAGLVSWVPVINTVGAVLAVVSLVLGLIGMRDTGPRRARHSGRWTAVGAVLLSLLALVIAISTMRAYSRVSDVVTQPAVPAAPGSTAIVAPGGQVVGAQQVAWGSPARFADGSALTCTRPVAAGPAAVGAVQVRTTCTFDNRSATPLDPTHTSAALVAGGAPATPVNGPGLGLPPGSLLPGGSTAWTWGFTAAAPEPAQLTVRLGLIDYQPVTFS